MITYRPVNNGHLIVTDFLEGHLAEPLMRDLDELLRHLTYSPLLTLDPTHLGWPSTYGLWCARVTLLHGRTFALTVARTKKRNAYTLHVDATMMSAELCHELNYRTIPQNAGTMSCAVDRVDHGT